MRMENSLTSNGVEGDLKKISKVGRGKRDLILIAALVGVAGLVGLVALEFRGSQVLRSAEAMTAPIPPAASQVAHGSAKP